MFLAVLLAEWTTARSGSSIWVYNALWTCTFDATTPSSRVQSNGYNVEVEGWRHPMEDPKNLLRYLRRTVRKRVGREVLFSLFEYNPRLFLRAVVDDGIFYKTFFILTEALQTISDNKPVSTGIQPRYYCVTQGRRVFMLPCHFTGTWL